MKLSYRELAPHLLKKIAPLYFISGDESLLVDEAASSIRKAAYHQGFTERVLITPDSSAPWENLLYSNAHSLSLFGEKKILELNLNETKLNAATGKILEAYAKKPPADTLLIIRTHKYDNKIEKTSWYQSLDQTGVIVSIWPITLDLLPQWIIERAKKANLTITKHAAEQLADRVEGNLLAAASEIEKFVLLSHDGVIDHHAIENMVTDHAHFDIFNLVEVALIGNTHRCIRILQSLRAEEMEPPIILWALTRELRLLAEIQDQIKQGMLLSNLFNSFRIWGKRKPGIQAFLRRHSSHTIWELLMEAARIDRIIKGAERGNSWDTLQNLCVKMAGIQVISEINRKRL